MINVTDVIPGTGSHLLSTNNQLTRELKIFQMELLLFLNDLVFHMFQCARNIRGSLTGLRPIMINYSLMDKFY